MLTGLGAGRDDYLTKPFPRRGAAGPGGGPPPGAAHAPCPPAPGELDFDLGERAVYWQGHAVEADQGEYAICEYLAMHPGQTFSKEQLYEAAFGYDGEADASAVTEHIKNIRAKLRPARAPLKPSGGGLQVEKRIRRPADLTALFWRYLITTGVVVILLAVLWWFGMTTMMRYGIVYPANTAASGGGGGGPGPLLRGTGHGGDPLLYRWAIFDGDGQVRDPGNMDEKHLAYAEAALAGGGTPGDVLLPVPPADPAAGRDHLRAPVRLPPCPTAPRCSSAACGVPDLRHRRSAARLADGGGHLHPSLRRPPAAGRRPAHRRHRSHRPAAAGRAITGRARVREFRATLKAMDDLRRNLAESLESQWGMEQQRRLELAALTHDLKTPPSASSAAMRSCWGGRL